MACSFPASGARKWRTRHRALHGGKLSTMQGTINKIQAVSNFRQGLAAARLRVWARARQSLKAGHRPNIVLRGRATHTNRTVAADAAVVMCIDFERALAKVPEPGRTYLVLRFRDGMSMEASAKAVDRSVRWAGYMEEVALEELADALALEDML